MVAAETDFNNPIWLVVGVLAIIALLIFILRNR